MTPGFLVIGGQRCGTTSLFKTLSQHPAVLPAVRTTRACTTSTPTTTGDGLVPRRTSRSSGSAERSSAQLGVRRLTGESSPYYMFHPLAAERIATDLPGVKLIVLLRDPVERAYSGARARARPRLRDRATFERALELEEERLAGEARAADRRSGLPQPLATSTTRYLAARPVHRRSSSGWRRCSAGTGCTSSTATTSSPTRGRPSTRSATSSACRTLGGHRASASTTRGPARPMSAELRARLEEHFAPYDERLASWWGRVPSWRR